MPVAAIWVGVLGSALVGEMPAPTAPLSWSPDGTWVAYVLATRAPEQALGPGWLLEPKTDGAPKASALEDARTYRLWASRPDTGDHLLLEESAGALSSSAWAPDGSAIAYARLGFDEGGDEPPALEVVIQDAPGQRRVLHRQPLTAVQTDEARQRLSGAALAWSPDGRFLAIPQLDAPGLAFLRLPNGQVLKRVEGARAPVWSADGQHIAFLRETGPGAAEVCTLDLNFGDPSALLTLPDAGGLPGPIWSRDGRSLLVMRRGQVGVGPDGHQATVLARMLRVDAETGEAQRLPGFVVEPVAGPAGLKSASFGLDADEGNLFLAINAEGQAAQIIWARLIREAVQSRFNPVDESVDLECLSLSTKTGQLALRARSAGPEGPVAICDPQTQELTPLVPDASARGEWLALLTDVAMDAMREKNQMSKIGVPERPTPLPAPFELGPRDLGVGRLRHLARVARPLCDRPAGAPPETPEFEAGLNEARFVFDYLEGDENGANYRAAADELAGLEGQAATPEARFRLLCLRAQVDLGLGEPERARRLIAHLRQSSPRALGQFEETGAGVVLTPTSDPMMLWLSVLNAATQPDPATDAELLNRSNLFGMPSTAVYRIDTTTVRPIPPSPPGIRPEVREAPGDAGRIDDIEIIVTPIPEPPRLRIDRRDQ